jgi:hypothetical protein
VKAANDDHINISLLDGRRTTFYSQPKRKRFEPASGPQEDEKF